MSHIVRVDSEVYGSLVRAKALLELATGQVVSLSDAVAFIIAVREIVGTEA